MRLTKSLAILTVFLLPLYLARFPLFSMPTNALEILALLTISAWIIEFRKNDILAPLKENRVFAVSLLLLFAGLFLSFAANDPAPSGLGIIKSWFAIPLLFSWAAIRSTEKEGFQALFLSLFFSTALVAAISLAYKFLGIVTYDNRLGAFYASPNYLAMFLSSGIFAGLGLLTEGSRATRCRRGYFFLLSLIFSFLLIASALYFTFSYAAWLSVIAGISFSFIMLKRAALSRKSFRVFLLALAASAILLFSQSDTEKLRSLAENDPRSSLASRAMIWQSSFKMLSDNFLLGIGPGNFQETYLDYQKYFPPYLEWAVPHPHNLYLAFWLQTGLLGLGAFLFLLALLFRSLVGADWKTKSASWALLGFFIYLAVHGLVDTPYWKNDLAYVFWIFASLTLLSGSSGKRLS